jgi:putative spermidine/putrescine transport system permease protein
MASPAVAAETPIQPMPRKPKKGDNSLLGYLLVSPPVLLMIFLIFSPALQSVFRTLVVQGDTTSTVTFERYVAFFQDPISVSNLLFTLRITLTSVAILFVLCFPLAIYLRFSHSRIAGWVQVLALFPLFVPGIILAYALIQFLGTHGILDSLLKTVGIGNYRQAYLKPEGIVIGLVWEGIPFTTLILTAGLRQVDDALVECARDVGASDWQVFRHILLPLIQRSAMIVLSLNFLGFFGAYTLPYLLGPAAPQMMGPFMQRTFNDVHDPGSAEVQAVVTFVVCSVVGFLYIRSVTRQQTERS